MRRTREVPKVEEDPSWFSDFVNAKCTYEEMCARTQLVDAALTTQDPATEYHEEPVTLATYSVQEATSPWSL